MANNQKFKDFETGRKTWETLIECAEANAVNDWQINFVSDLSNRFEQYGLDGFLSQKQYDKLLDLADW